jgi:hypothetical protein
LYNNTRRYVVSREKRHPAAIGTRLARDIAVRIALKGGKLLKNCERLGAGIARVVIYKNVVYERLELCCKEENSPKIFGLN